MPGVGCFVYVKSPEDSTKYEKAIVMEKTKEAVTLKTLSSGVRLTSKMEDNNAVLYNEEPSLAELKLGTCVIAEKDSSRNTAAKFKMTRGRIVEVNPSSRGGPMCKVHFDDGKTKLLSSEQIRLVPERVGEKRTKF